MSNEKLITAGYCGLACKACSVYIASQIGREALERRAAKAGMSAEEMYCKGCRSDKTSPYCTDCQIKRCIREKNLTWCSECEEYPCTKITEFKESLPHRAEIMDSLDFAKLHTVEEWDKLMEKEFTCGNCGTYNSVYAESCSRCGNIPVNAFASRHWELIKDSEERKNL